MALDSITIPDVSFQELMDDTTLGKTPEDLTVNIDVLLLPAIREAAAKHLDGLSFMSECEADWLHTGWEQHINITLLRWLYNHSMTCTENTLEPSMNMHLRRPRDCFDTVGWPVRIEGELYLYSPLP